MDEAAEKSGLPVATPSGNYSRIFERLVRDADDLVGLVAYGLYKQSKRDWIIRFYEENGSRPGQADLENHYKYFSAPADLERFRSEAEKMMLSFAEVIVDDRQPEIEDAVRNREFLTTKNEIIQEIRERTSFWGSVTANMVAWGLSLAVTIAIITIFNWTLIVGAFKRALGVE